MLMMMTMIIKRLRLLNKGNIESMYEREKEREGESEATLFNKNKIHTRIVLENKKPVFENNIAILNIACTLSIKSLHTYAYLQAFF